MVLINGSKYACERCIRGHRVTTCTHTDQPLMMIKPKGRPSTTCDLCKELRKNKKAINTVQNGICTCGRLEKKRQLQKLKEEAKTKAKLLAKEAKLKKRKSNNSINIPISSPQSTHSLLSSMANERRGSDLSLFNNMNSNGSPNSVIDRRNSFHGNSHLFSNKFFLDSNTFLDSGITNNSTTSNGKITKDYHRVTSMASISSLQSQQSLEQSFSSPQSPQFNNHINLITGHQNTNLSSSIYSTNNSDSHLNLSDFNQSSNKKAVEIKKEMDDVISNIDIQPRSNFSTSATINSNSNSALNTNYMNNKFDTSNNSVGLLDSFMDSSSISEISRATYLSHENNKHHSNNPFSANISPRNSMNWGNNVRIKSEHIDNPNLDFTNNNNKSNSHNKNDDANSILSVEVLSLTPNFLDLNENSELNKFQNSDMINYNATTNDNNNTTNRNNNNNNDNSILFPMPSLDPFSSRIYSKPKNNFINTEIANSMSRAANINSLQTDLDQLLMQTNSASENEDLLNI